MSEYEITSLRLLTKLWWALTGMPECYRSPRDIKTITDVEVMIGDRTQESADALVASYTK